MHQGFPAQLRRDLWVQKAPGHLLHSVPKNELAVGMRPLAGAGGSHKRTDDKLQGPQMCCSLKACCELSPLPPAQPHLYSLRSFEGNSHGKAVCFWMMGLTEGCNNPWINWFCKARMWTQKEKILQSWFVIESARIFHCNSSCPIQICITWLL